MVGPNESPHPEASPLLTPEQVAQRCSLSVKAVYRAIKREELAAAKLCGRWRVRPEDLDAWIASSMFRSSPAPRSRLPMPSPAAPVRATLEALRAIERA